MIEVCCKWCGGSVVERCPAMSDERACVMVERTLFDDDLTCRTEHELREVLADLVADDAGEGDAAVEIRMELARRSGRPAIDFTACADEQLDQLAEYAREAEVRERANAELNERALRMAEAAERGERIAEPGEHRAARDEALRLRIQATLYNASAVIDEAYTTLRGCINERDAQERLHSIARKMREALELVPR